MKIAVEGCAHGELDKIYECVETIQQREQIKVDLLICCGDFQSVRNKDDLKAMAVPEKYQNICTFYKYYSGEKRAPVLTIFIGGNHEASNYLQELPYGGWVAPNIYYLGRAGVVRFGNLRIGGLSGIFKGRDYLQGLWECPPYNQNSLRSVYHIRSIDTFRLSQLNEHVHVMLTHDWPRGITSYGDKDNLLKRKPFLREDVESNELGSKPAENLLHTLKPDYWFAAHLHCQFAAIVEHKNGDATTETKFLALDKCLPKRRHLQILEVPSDLDGNKCLKYDAEWLAVLRNTNHLMTVKNVDCHMPGPGGQERYDFKPTEEEITAAVNLIGDLTIKEDSFVKTAPAYTVNSPRGVAREPVLNPQTVHFCKVLGIDDPLQVLMARSGKVIKEAVLDPTTIPEETANTATVKEPVEVVTPKRSSSLLLPAPRSSLSRGAVYNIVHDDSVCTPENSTFVSDTADVTANTATANEPVEVVTPKRSLPATLSSAVYKIVHDDSICTPENNTLSSAVKNIVHDDSICTPEANSTFVSSTTDETPQTPFTPGRKIFKRRNHAIYTPDEGDESVTTSGSVDAESPVSSKLPYKRNPMLQSLDES